MSYNVALEMPFFEKRKHKMLTQNNIDLVQTHNILLFCFAFPDWLEKLEEPGKDIFPGAESEAIKCPLGKCVS